MSMRNGTSSKPTDVYRLYDVDGNLLYVGVAVNGYARLDAHKRYMHWWPLVARVVMTRYENRRVALAVEAVAIRDENPIHNVTRGYYRADDVVATAAPIELDEYAV